MLRACRRLLRPGGRVAYFTITVADDLTPAKRRRAVHAGPRAVSSKAPQADLLRRAGFADVDETDVTDDYLRTIESWTLENERRRDDLRAADPEAFDERMADTWEALHAARDGLLRRSLLVACRAG